jgi:hypothetical protein
VASLQARSPLRSAHPLFFINKLISLIAFALLLGGGWVAVCYLKAELTDRWRVPGDSQKAPASAVTGASAASNPAPAGAQAASAPVRLVYSCAGEDQHYHTSTHLPARCERSALGEEAAFQRGLKPCPVCIKR